MASLALERGMDRSAAGNVADLHRSPFGVGRPTIAPVQERLDDREELAPPCCQLVLGSAALARLLIGRALEHIVVDEGGESLTEH